MTQQPWTATDPERDFAYGFGRPSLPYDAVQTGNLSRGGALTAARRVYEVASYRVIAATSKEAARAARYLINKGIQPKGSTPREAENGS